LSLRPAHSSIDSAEVEKFSAIASEWWSLDGKFAPLHRFNPVRLRFIRETAERHFARPAHSLRPFEGLTLLDIGCGGGLLSEPMARLGYSVVGADASENNVLIARAHAAAAGVAVDYRCTTAEALVDAGACFDVVLNMEVAEHVADPKLYLDSCAHLVRPGGIMFVATLNKTLKAFALAKIGAEYVLGWLPRGTHEWSRFIEPKKLSSMLQNAGLEVRATQGLSFDPIGWDWRLSSDTDVNYIVVAARPKIEIGP
jgi:2-polyprenyl-6-hydroxyphenyl methylase/3-demethylubiquinone-9 3-methyltransferase